jgi:hypothetical protein
VSSGKKSSDSSTECGVLDASDVPHVVWSSVYPHINGFALLESRKNDERDRRDPNMKGKRVVVRQWGSNQKKGARDKCYPVRSSKLHGAKMRDVEEADVCVCVWGGGGSR